ncbi:MAG TPA: hypothetical protein VMQ93_05655 [Novosphingobium sp.]|nr:hypothetical protein [Novosphingobium sp.]
MIQTTAPTLNAGIPQTAGSLASNAVPGLPGADFAALLGLPQAPVAVTVPASAIAAQAVLPPMPPEALGEAVKGAQDGLAALALQAGVAARPAAESLAAKDLRFTIEVPRAPVATLPVATDGLPPAPPMPAMASPFTRPSAPVVVAGPSVVVNALPAEVGPDIEVAPSALMRVAEPAVPTTASHAAAKPGDGKSGKAGGNILPPAALTTRARREAAAAEPEPEVADVPVDKPAEPTKASPVTEAATPVARAEPAIVSLAVPVTVAAPQPAPSALATPPHAERRDPAADARAPLTTATPKATLPKGNDAPVAAEAVPASSASLRAVRFEPIEIVAAEAPEPVAAQPTAVPISATPAPATSHVAEPAALPVAPFQAATPQPAVMPTVVAEGAPSPSAPQASADTSPTSTPRATPAPTVETRPGVFVEPAEQPAAQAPLPHATERHVTTAPQTASTPPAAVAGNGPVQAIADTRPEASIEPATSAPAQVERRAGKAFDAEPAPASLAVEHPTPHVAQPVVADGPATVAASAPDGPGAVSAAPTETPQDFDTLVSRLAEAREAATPHVVRTAMAHGEFGRISMQLDHSDGGLSVTMASRDPEFTSAVQAAAAAMAGNASPGSDQPRQDGSAQQQGAANQNQAQGQQGPQTGANGGLAGGQGQQGRADASGQQSRRDGSGFARQQEQQPSGPPAQGRGDQRPGGGVYA